MELNYKAAKGNDLTVRVNGVAVCYDDLGTGSTPLLFIHGFPFDKSSWKPQVDHLKASHRVIAYDIRGFGKSTSGNEKASMSLYADDLIQLMDVLQVDKVVACGLSMGGYILLNAVSRYADRFEAIVLSDTQCIADSPEAKEKRRKTIQLIKDGGLNDFAEGFSKNVFCKDSFTDKKEEVERIKKIVLNTSPETVIGTLAALAERDETCSSLADISVPALILCGQEDIITPPAQSEFLHNHIRNSTYHSIAKAGHLTNLEQPGEFNKYIDSFISGIMKRP